MNANVKSTQVAIVGCGPAGVVAASLLASKGLQVQVFDKLGSAAGAKDERAFVISLNAKGRRAVVEANFDLDRITQPNNGVVQCSALAISRTSIFPWVRRRELKPPPGSELVVGSRAAWVTQLVRQAEERHPEFIAIHWNSAVERVDLEKRQLSVRSADGTVASLHYDLLIGADGSYSQVRQAMEAQVPGMHVVVEPSDRRYKVFRGLKLAELDGGEAMPPALSFVANVSQDSPQFGFVLVVPRAQEDLSVGYLSMRPEAWDALTSEEDYRSFLAANFPTLPPAWVPQIAAQFAVNKQNVAGVRVHSNRLAAGGVVLIGDAGHSVTPSAGNGFNAALEDALILHRVLCANGGDLEALPQQFEATRRDDAAALVWLDEKMWVCLTNPRRDRLGFFAHNYVHIPVRRVLHSLTGGYVAESPLQYVSDHAEVPYSEGKRIWQRDDALLALIATALAVGAVARVVPVIVHGAAA